MLLEAGADKDAAREDGSAALYFAAAEGHLEVVRLLLEAGADKETAREDGSTPLYFAALKGRLEVVRLLLEAALTKNQQAKIVQGWLRKASWKLCVC